MLPERPPDPDTHELQTIRARLIAYLTKIDEQLRDIAGKTPEQRRAWIREQTRTINKVGAWLVAGLAVPYALLRSHGVAVGLAAGIAATAAVMILLPNPTPRPDQVEPPPATPTVAPTYSPSPAPTPSTTPPAQLPELPPTPDTSPSPAKAPPPPPSSTPTPANTQPREASPSPTTTPSSPPSEKPACIDETGPAIDADDCGDDVRAAIVDLLKRLPLMT